MTTIDKLPKAELHCHLEGTMPAPLVRRLARRNGIQLAEGLFDRNDRFIWNDFGAFLRAYDAGAGCLRTAQDYCDITFEYLAACAAEGALYVELFASPDHAAMVGISYTGMLEGCVRAIEEAERLHGICGRIIITAVRHLGPARALDVARQMIAEPHPWVVGFGMGGDETLFSPEDFLPAYKLADEAGYGCTVHAGEVCGPESVREAIAKLPISRIGHGVRASEDNQLVAELSRRRIALEICPGSNIALDIYSDFQQHPLVQLLEAGCRISLNSDDPPFFDTSLGNEYCTAAREFGLKEQQLREITGMALDAAFIDEQLRQQLKQRCANRK